MRGPPSRLILIYSLLINLYLLSTLFFLLIPISQFSLSFPRLFHRNTDHHPSVLFILLFTLTVCDIYVVASFCPLSTVWTFSPFLHFKEVLETPSCIGESPRVSFTIGIAISMPLEILSHLIFVRFPVVLFFLMVFTPPSQQLGKTTLSGWRPLAHRPDSY